MICALYAYFIETEILHVESKTKCSRRTGLTNAAINAVQILENIALVSGWEKTAENSPVLHFVQALMGVTLLSTSLQSFLGTAGTTPQTCSTFDSGNFVNSSLTINLTREIAWGVLNEYPQNLLGFPSILSGSLFLTFWRDDLSSTMNGDERLYPILEKAFDSSANWWVSKSTEERLHQIIKVAKLILQHASEFDDNDAKCRQVANITVLRLLKRFGDESAQISKERKASWSEVYFTCLECLIKDNDLDVSFQACLCTELKKDIHLEE